MASENDSFDKSCDGICQANIKHPHIFGNATVSKHERGAGELGQIKRQEKSLETYTDTQSVPKSFCTNALLKKGRIRAAKAGFDWDSTTAPCKSYLKNFKA